MPRVAGIFQPPPATYGQPGNTIESVRYNALVNDLVADANAARPVTAGGTGATDKASARTALGFDDTYTHGILSARYLLLPPAGGQPDDAMVAATMADGSEATRRADDDVQGGGRRDCPRPLHRRQGGPAVTADACTL